MALEALWRPSRRTAVPWKGLGPSRTPEAPTGASWRQETVLAWCSGNRTAGEACSTSVGPFCWWRCTLRACEERTGSVEQTSSRELGSLPLFARQGDGRAPRTFVRRRITPGQLFAAVIEEEAGFGHLSALSAAGFAGDGSPRGSACGPKSEDLTPKMDQKVSTYPSKWTKK
jgi:hypothetical protein